MFARFLSYVMLSMCCLMGSSYLLADVAPSEIAAVLNQKPVGPYKALSNEFCFEYDWKDQGDEALDGVFILQEGLVFKEGAKVRKTLNGVSILLSYESNDLVKFISYRNQFLKNDIMPFKQGQIQITLKAISDTLIEYEVKDIKEFANDTGGKRVFSRFVRLPKNATKPIDIERLPESYNFVDGTPGMLGVEFFYKAVLQGAM